MVIDTSAIVAIFFAEPERDLFLRRIEEAPRRRISAGNLLELRMVISRVKEQEGVAKLERFLERAGIEVVAFDREQADIAAEGFLRYGKGRDAAGLNFGDCFAYALAKQTGEPLLFKGDDFGRTDVKVA